MLRTDELFAWRPRCPRCDGFLETVYIDLIDLSEFNGVGGPFFWERCVNCGERLDARIFVNRQVEGRLCKPKVHQDAKKKHCWRNFLNTTWLL